jgi:large subunit ribosomal protein L13
MKTYMAKKADVQRRWYVVDATDLVLGRLASSCATILRGKNKPEYTPHVDCGDYVVVINAEKVKVTGNKRQDKLYHRHTGYPGGIKSPNFQYVIDRHPTRPLEKAVKGMLPKGPLGRQMASKLKVVAGPEHGFTAQKPENITEKLKEQ